mgnify:CR=1 FL=1
MGSASNHSLVCLCGCVWEGVGGWVYVGHWVGSRVGGESLGGAAGSAGWQPEGAAQHVQLQVAELLHLLHVQVDDKRMAVRLGLGLGLGLGLWWLGLNPR